MAEVSVFVPGSIGNVGPGFDVLGLALSEYGDIVTVELVDEVPEIRDVSGLDADMIPRDPTKNCATIAAEFLLKSIGEKRHAAVSLKRQLPSSGGVGASAAASVGGAFATALATGKTIDTSLILMAALTGETAVAGRHLDNIAPSLFGGLCIVTGLDPPRVARVPPKKEWWLTIVCQIAKLATKTARGVLPKTSPMADWTRQMALASGLVAAFANGDEELVKSCLQDPFAEPRRAHLIPNFDVIKKTALKAGALGVSISGAGPATFALSADEATARRVGEEVTKSVPPKSVFLHIGPVGLKGVHQI